MVDVITHILTAVGAFLVTATPLLISLKRAYARNKVLSDEADQKLRESDAKFQSDAWRQIVKDIQANYNKMTQKVSDLEDQHREDVARIEELHKSDMVKVELREKKCLEDNVVLCKRVDELERLAK